MSILEVGSGNLPNVYFEKINITENDEYLTVQVRLNVRDFKKTPQDNAEFVWHNTLIEQYAKINLLVIPVTYTDNEENQLAEKTIEYINEGRTNQVNIEYTPNLIVMEKSLIEYGGIGTHANESGETVYDMTYDMASFALEIDNLKTVYMYANVYIDLQNLGASQYDFGTIDKYIGDTSSEIMMKDGSIPTESYYFMNKENGRIWPGPVHYHSEKGWMGGSKHIEGPHPELEQKFISNLKLNWIEET